MVPFMRTFGYDIRKSIGTAAAVGFLIAATGTTTMIIGGKIINNVNTPYSLGYINLLGFIVFVPVTMLMARMGAKAVYKINKSLLSKIFGSFLIIVSIRSFLRIFKYKLDMKNMFNLKDIISSIADVGQKLFKKTELKRNDLETILSLCDDLISNKGAAFGITVARDVTNLYQTLTPENKLAFFKKINEKFKPSHTKVSEAIENYQKTQNDKNLFNLFIVSEGKRRELFRRMNMAPNGISTIVSLREDLLKVLKENSELKPLDDDLRELFKSWFNPGFLRLAKITWDTKAAVLEKIMKYERVHKIKDMDELKRRLGEDRRFFSYFHPALEDEPIIFVQVALTNGLGKSIQEITKPHSTGNKNYDTATFYSISNCQEGLSRVTLGNFLIKRVVYEIQEELPNIKHFGTLSPIPGFRDWFSYLEDNKIKNILGNIPLENISFLKSPDLRIGDTRIVSNKDAILKLVAHYLINEKNHKQLPINDVTRFHLGNGAIVEDININANVSEVGFNRSFGVMVNYLYELKNIEKNHEDYINNKKVIVSDKLKKFI